MPAKITDLTRINTIVDDFKNGMSKKAIGQKHNLSQPTVRQLLQENFNQAFSRIPQPTIDHVISLSQILYSINSIAKAANIDKNTVSRIITKYNLTIASKPKKQEKLKSSRITLFAQLEEAFSVEYITELLANANLHQAAKITHTRCDVIAKFADLHQIPYKKAFIYCADIPKDLEPKVIADFLQFVPKNKIALKYNLSSTHINWILKANQIVLPPKYERTEFHLYAKLVRRLTTVVVHHHKITAAANYHWDHRLSIYDGFLQKIPPYIIASMENLELVPAGVNLAKGTNSSLSKHELYQKLGII